MLTVVTNVLGGEYWWAGVLVEGCSTWFWLPGKGEGNFRVKTEEQEPVKQTRINNKAMETD